MSSEIRIGERTIGPGHPVFIVAELSANHGQTFERAVELIHEAHAAGADAVKLQTYTPDTLTFDSEKGEFQVGSSGPWAHRTLYELYSQAFTPWEWQPKLKEIAGSLKLPLFSSPFDFSAVEFLEKMDVPAYKIASFELVDLPLIKRVAATGKPMIISTGMASAEEISLAVSEARASGCDEIVLLKCTSAYPARPDEMNLKTIPHMSKLFEVPVGLSDHTLDITVPIAAVALGAVLVEKHLTLTRAQPGPDSAFSLEPAEFKEMVNAVRITERALGEARYGPGGDEVRNLRFRRSLFVTQFIPAGAVLTPENIRSIRPASGLPPKYYEQVLGRTAVKDIEPGTPLSWDLIGNG